MQLSILEPVFHTYIVSFILVSAILVSLRFKSTSHFLSKEATQELKGFAIIAILFAHIGYYLVSDHRFLFPLSVLAGVGVDLFLFLSGLGLTISALARPLAPFDFYRKRLSKLFVPLWISLAIIFAVDAVILHHTYGLLYTMQTFLGIVTHADMYADVNSPLWYFTLILFYYLIFPLLFWRRAPYVSAAAIYAASLAIIHLEPSFFANVMPLYKTHLAAFPLGVFAAYFIRNAKHIDVPNPYYVPLLGLLAVAVGYLAINSEVGSVYWLAQVGSIFTMILILAFFALKRFEIRFFTLFGAFSFEIYLIHWPLLYRYDIFFQYLPASLAVILYFALFLALAWTLQLLIQKISHFVY